MAHGPPGNTGVHRKTYNHKAARSSRRRGINTMEQKIAERLRKNYARMNKKTTW